MSLNLESISPEEAEIIKARLPETARNLVRIIGFEATMTMVREFGGLEIRVFAESTKEKNSLYAKLVELIGTEKADAFGKEYSEEQALYVPMCRDSMSMLRRYRIIKRYDELTRSISGRKAVDILAKEYGLSNRAVEDAVNSSI